MDRQKSYVIPREIAESVIRDAMAVASLIHTDQLDISVSWRREPTKKTPEEVLQLGLKSKDPFWVFIFRHIPREYVDVGVVATVRDKDKHVDYFLWVEISHESAHNLVSKYKLKSLT
jgi:hypothetical protein